MTAHGPPPASAPRSSWGAGRGVALWGRVLPSGGAEGERRQSLSVLDLGREGEPGPGDGRDLASIREEHSGSCAETAPFGASCWAPTACANSPGDLGAHACHPAPLGHAVGAGGPAGAGLPRSRRCPGLGEAAPRFAPPFLRQQLVSNSVRTPPHPSPLRLRRGVPGKQPPNGIAEGGSGLC